MWAFGVCYETPEFLKNLLSWPTSSGYSNRAGKGSLSFLLGVGGSLSLQRTRPCPYSASTDTSLLAGWGLRTLLPTSHCPSWGVASSRGGGEVLGPVGIL